MANTEPLAVDIPGVAELLSTSRAHIYNLISAGKFGPERIRLGGKSVRVSVAELRAWLAAGAPAQDQWKAMRGAAR